MSIHDHAAALDMLQQWVNADPHYRSFRVEYGKLEGEMTWEVTLCSRRYRGRKVHSYSDDSMARAVVAAVEDANTGRTREETPF